MRGAAREFSWCATGGSRWRRWKVRRRREEHFDARTPFVGSTPPPCGSPSAKWGHETPETCVTTNSFVLVSHLHLCYLVLRRSRLLLFLPSFKFHLPERWSVVTFLSMPNFARHYLFLSSSFCSVRMILLGDWSADLKWTQILWVMAYFVDMCARKD